MNVTIHIGQTTARLWHVRLLERLSRRPGLKLNVTDAPGSGGLPRGMEILFRFETLLHGLARPGLATLAAPGSLAHFHGANAGPPDLTLDLAGTIPQNQGNVWRLTFDGAPGERSLLASIVAGRAPVAALDNGVDIVAIGRLGTEHDGITLATFEDCLARAITLIAAALDGAASRGLPSQDLAEAPTSPAARRFGLWATGKKVAKDLARTLARRFYTLFYHAPHWRVGWRRVDGEDTIGLRQHPASGWTTLADDQKRFFADPFPFEYKGAVTLFVEEFDHRLQKGIISAIPFGPDGPIGPAEPVLDLPYHLSYPFVFEQEGQVWMIPESCAARSIDLYRATDYPRGWVHAARLVDGVVASDATIVQHGGRWWMFATVQDNGGAYSDALYLWSAPDFRGPWTPHSRNPVLIDIASARPAGRIVERGGSLIRPVQDCRLGYGNALGLARIIRLDDENFEQVVEATLHAGPGWPGRRLHTLNTAGGLEFIDGSGSARRGFTDMLRFNVKAIPMPSSREDEKAGAV
ncbi:MAG: formyl transferase [Beijerinckiaceae bacterium]